MNIYYLASILAAFMWALTASVNTTVVRYVGVMTMNRWRMVVASTLLWVVTFFYSDIQTISHIDIIIPTVMSGIIGIFIGDTALYASIKNLGTRRVGILYTLASPFTIIIGILFLGEMITLRDFIACTIITSGIAIVILAKDKSETSKSAMENIQGNWKHGVAWGVLAALCQAIGIIIARPIMELGTVDFVPFSAVRLTAALIPMLILRHYIPRFTIPLNKITLKHWGGIIFSATGGMVIGMSLVIFALQGGNAGIVSTLSSITPAFVLPIVWYQAKKCPSIQSWLGAGLVILGTAILSL